MNRDPSILLEAARGLFSHCCLFLDVDGTLLELAAAPESVSVPADLIAQLERLCAALGGAVALVSGRTVAELDRLFSPLRLPAAGIHGLERRARGGMNPLGSGDPARLHAARETLQRLVDRHRGLRLEDKRGAIALHFRADPTLEETARGQMSAIARGLGPAYHVLAGRMVFELTPLVPNKGTAIEEFLAEPPFIGRMPVFLGDDVGDQPGLHAVACRGGISIAVGPNVNAPWKLADTLAVRRWLDALLLRVERAP